MKNFKKNQVVIFVIALMLITAGYLNFSNEQREKGNLLPTSSLADSELMASIGDATLVNANEMAENKTNNQVASNEVSNTNVTNNTEAQNMVSSNSNTVEENNQSNQATSEDSYFVQSRLDRDKMYSQMLENYQKILETSNIDAEEKTNAQTEITRINNEKNAIMIAENLIKTKGFADVVLFVNNGNVSAIIKAEKLDANQIAQIQNTITRELNVKVNKINVSSKN